MVISSSNTEEHGFTQNFPPVLSHVVAAVHCTWVCHVAMVMVLEYVMMVVPVSKWFYSKCWWFYALQLRFYAPGWWFHSTCWWHCVRGGYAHCGDGCYRTGGFTPRGRGYTFVVQHLLVVLRHAVVVIRWWCCRWNWWRWRRWLIRGDSDSRTSRPRTTNNTKQPRVGGYACALHVLVVLHCACWWLYTTARVGG